MMILKKVDWPGYHCELENHRMGKWLYSEQDRTLNVNQKTAKRDPTYSHAKGSSCECKMDECNSELLQTKSDKVVGERP